MEGKKQPELLLAYYGDDFTGSTDVMEALSLAGIRCVLFLGIPDERLLRDRFPGTQAFGIAGVGRSLTPGEMETELRPVFAALEGSSAAIVHYKLCSTFDSSPETGSIGRAIELALERFSGQRYVPLLVGAPPLRRYTVFGHHYAGAGQAIERLDRHPTMARHPVTPMDEADLRIHLGRQTARSVGLLDILELDGDPALVRRRLRAKVEAEDGAPDIVLFDTLDEARLRTTGELLWKEATERGIRFVAGSSGVEYALAAHWRDTGTAGAGGSLLREAEPVSRLFAISGSCSPDTEAQIRYALRSGFTGIRVDARRLIGEDKAARTRAELLGLAERIWLDGGSPLIYSALGSEELDAAGLKRLMAEAGIRSADTGRLIGEQLGKLAREAALALKPRRMLIAGGDTSGYATRELGIYALECVSPLAPGAPLCLARSRHAAIDGLELALKGGQVGKADFIVRVKDGR